MADAELWALFRAAADIGPAAWPPLAAALAPVLAGFARSQPIGRLRDSEDSKREIVTRALTRLHARELAAIKKLCAIHPPPELLAWLRVIVRRSAIDYMREHPEFDRAATRWITLATLASTVPGSGPDSLDVKRVEVLRFVSDMVARAASEIAAHGDDAIARLALDWKIERVHTRRLVARHSQYLEVLTGVLEGDSYPDLATRLGITRREVELTVRYLEQLLAARGFPG